jgi:MFS family permease
VKNPDGTDKKARAVRLTKDEKFNFVSCLIDSGGWTFGMAFFSTSTIVPAFLCKLGAGNVIIGLLPALITLGYTTPGILFAGVFGRLSRIRTWLLPGAILERIPLLLTGVSILTIHNRSVLLLVFLSLFVIHAIILGVDQPAYWIIISKAIPEQWRGRLFGSAGLLGGLLSFAVLPVAGHLLASTGAEPMHGFAWCFIVGSIILIVTVLPLGFIREAYDERAKSSKAPAMNSSYFSGIWRSSSGFRWFIWSQAWFAIWLIAGPFYVLDGIRRLHVTAAEIGLFTAIGAVVAAFGGSLCGLLSDRSGNRVVLIISGVAACLASFVALLADNSEQLIIVFALSSFAAAGAGLAGYNITMEFAPSDRDIPHYTSFYNLVLAPVRAVGLIAGGLISASFAFAPVFVISTAAAAVCVALTFRLVEPRHKNQTITTLEHPI